MKKICAMLALFCIVFSSCNQSGKKNEESARIYIKALDLYSQNNMSESMKLTDTIIKENPRFYQAYFLKGKILFFDKKTLEAKNTFALLVKKYPEYFDARLWLIRTLTVNAEYDAAIGEIEKALTFNSGEWRLYYQYALAAEGKNQIDMKIQMLEKADQNLSESVKVYIDESEIWYSLNLKEKALLSLEKATVLAKGSGYFEGITENLHGLIKR